MKISDRTIRTRTNPLRGVEFEEFDERKIHEIIVGLSHVPEFAVDSIRAALAGEIIQLEERIERVVDGDFKQELLRRYENAILTYRATDQVILANR